MAFALAFTFHVCVSNLPPLGGTSVSGVWAQLGPCSRGWRGGCCQGALVWKASPRSPLQDRSLAPRWPEVGLWRSPPHSAGSQGGGARAGPCCWRGVQPGAGFRGTHLASSRMQTWRGPGRVDWAGGWPGRPRLGATRSRPSAVSAPEALGCVDSAVLCNSGQTVHNCPRGNGFSLNLQFFLLNRQPIFQGFFSVLRNCTRRAPSRALTSGSSLKLLFCSYPGPCPLHPA